MPRHQSEGDEDFTSSGLGDEACGKKSRCEDRGGQKLVKSVGVFPLPVLVEDRRSSAVTYVAVFTFVPKTEPFGRSFAESLPPPLRSRDHLSVQPDCTSKC